MNTNGCKFQKVIGDYLLTDEIGKGAFGRVYKAVRRPSGEEFACKVIPLRGV